MNFIAGTIGHVAHGKSTVVKALSGVQVPLFVLYEFLWPRDTEL